MKAIEETVRSVLDEVEDVIHNALDVVHDCEILSEPAHIHSI